MYLLLVIFSQNLLTNCISFPEQLLPSAGLNQQKYILSQVWRTESQICQPSHVLSRAGKVYCMPFYSVSSFSNNLYSCLAGSWERQWLPHTHMASFPACIFSSPKDRPSNHTGLGAHLSPIRVHFN